MAFRIESLDEMSNIATAMDTCNTSATVITSNTLKNIDTLLGLVSGRGVDKSLSNLRSAVEMNSTKMQNLLSEISAFIRSQTASYTVSKENAESTLLAVEAALDEIKID